MKGLYWSREEEEVKVEKGGRNNHNNTDRTQDQNGPLPSSSVSFFYQGATRKREGGTLTTFHGSRPPAVES